MIRQLRDGHRRVVTLLLLGLPLGYLAIVSARGPAREHAAPILPDQGGRVPQGPSFPLLAEPGIGAFLLARPGAGPDALLIVPDGDPAIPDLLAYWSPTAGDGRELPPDAMLIGALRGGRRQVLPLPAPEMMRGGYLILYSLVRGEILAAVHLPGSA